MGWAFVVLPADFCNGIFSALVEPCRELNE